MLTLISCSSHLILFFLSIEFEISARKDCRHDNNPHICTEYRIQTWRHSSSSSHLILTTRRLEIEEDRPQKQVEIGDDNNKKGSGILWLLFSLFYLETFPKRPKLRLFLVLMGWRPVMEESSPTHLRFLCGQHLWRNFPRTSPLSSYSFDRALQVGGGGHQHFLSFYYTKVITTRYCKQTRIQWTLVICHKKSSPPPPARSVIRLYCVSILRGVKKEKKKKIMVFPQSKVSLHTDSFVLVPWWCVWNHFFFF